MAAAIDSARQRLKLLLDSNVFIAVEPYAGAMEPSTVVGAQLVRLANEQGHLLCIAPATRDDLLEGRDPSRRRQRLAEIEKFHQLAEVPIDSGLAALAGVSPPGSNDHRDLRILAALAAGAATHLVTEDHRLRRRARRAGLADAVLSIVEAVDLLKRFVPISVEPPPRVTRIPTYAIDIDQRIFGSIRDEYPGFDEWLNRVRADSDNRICFLVTDTGNYAAIALLKAEEDCTYSIPRPVTKISTFKVERTHAGVKYGELLLKAVLKEASDTGVASLYVEVLPTHPEVVDFFSDFGFQDGGDRTVRNEIVLHKIMRRAAPVDVACSDLEFHIRFGPPALRPTQSAFVVPIQPVWHDQLFPELANPLSQPSLFTESDVPSTYPWGNALRKAYLCNAAVQSIREGDLILFYRSRDVRAVTVLGIVENVLRSTDPQSIVTFVGRRTVYSPGEIANMCRHARGVLAIRFRQDRFIESPWDLAELQLAGVLRGWPQTVVTVPERGMQWVLEQIGE